MTRRPAADRAHAKQFGGNEFNRVPVRLLGQQMLHLGEQAALKPFRAAFAGRWTARLRTNLSSRAAPSQA